MKNSNLSVFHCECIDAKTVPIGKTGLIIAGDGCVGQGSIGDGWGRQSDVIAERRLLGDCLKMQQV